MRQTPDKPTFLGQIGTESSFRCLEVLVNMVARDGIEWNYVPLDGLILYPNPPNAEFTDS